MVEHKVAAPTLQVSSLPHRHMNHIEQFRQPFMIISSLCRGDHHLLSGWIEKGKQGSIPFCLLLIILGCGTYGFTIGMRNGALMALYVGIKFPLIILLTLAVNGMINGMLSLLLGSGIGFRQSFQFLLIGFAIMGVIFGSLSPISFFATLNMPDSSVSGSENVHSLNLLLHTLIIAFAGIQSHAILLNFVRHFTDNEKAGTHTFYAWLAGNLFVGAQISWILRPWFLTPGFDVQFVRPDAFEGSFYESVFKTLMNLIF